MIVELHMIQNFAPSNLNRDDTGSPKDCTFGGVRRSRISSQCLKRAIRTSAVFANAVGETAGTRTRHLLDEIVKRVMASRPDLADDEARAIVHETMGAAGFKLGKPNEKKSARTQVLLYLSPGEIAAYAHTIHDAWDVLDEAWRESVATTKAKFAPPKEVMKSLKSGASTVDAADIALFGRMVAESTSMSIEAACQVAHAISTHEVAPEMDFYTAVDDLNPREDTGAGMMGIIEYNSACLYRYAAVNTDQLAKNLSAHAASVANTVRAFCEAAIQAIPSGKQNSMAAHNLPSFVQVVVRDGGLPRSYANAFARPVRARDADGDLVKASIGALKKYAEALDQMYGAGGARLVRSASTYEEYRDEGCTIDQLCVETEQTLA